MSSLLWKPDTEQVEHANITAFIRFVQKNYSADISDYQTLYKWSVTSRGEFWTALWCFADVIGEGELLPAVRDADKMPGASWFPETRLNFAENLLRYRDERPALVFRSETGVRKSVSYRELHQQVASIARYLKQLGVKPGDRVAGFLPNVPEAVIAMLATTSIGAIWSSCSPDFGFQGVLDRFGQIAPKVLFACDGYTFKGKKIDCIERILKVSESIASLEQIVIISYLSTTPDLSSLKGARLFSAIIEEDNGGDEIAFERLPFGHPVYIMYSSGTTGVPKCIVHGAGGTLLQHLKEHVLHTDIGKDDKLFYFTTCGWMMWNWLVSGLASGATLLLYDGSPFYPDESVLFDYAESSGMTVFGTSAKYISALEKTGFRPNEHFELSSLRTMLSTGSPLLPENFDYVYTSIKKNLLLSSIAGGTDIVSCFCLGNPVAPVYRGEIQTRGLGMDVHIYNDAGESVRGARGELVCASPFPSMPVCFWNDEDGKKYHEAYFARFDNVWCHGDWAEITEHEGMIIYGRSDATLNPGGVRIGTAEIYREVEKLEEVVESIVIGQEWQSDTRVVLFVKLRPDAVLDDELCEKIRSGIKTNTTPRHVPAKIIQVADIPRTISGKIVELAVKNIIHGLPVKNAEALINPEALEYFKDLAELRT